MKTNDWRVRIAATVLCSLAAVSSGWAGDRLTLNMRDVSVAEIMELLSHKARTNIVMTDGASGTVSVNLYDIELDQAIEAVASAAGLVVEQRRSGYFIMPRSSVGKRADSGFTTVRSFEVSYVGTDVATAVVTPLLSEFGEVIAVPERRIVMVRDKPEFVDLVARTLQSIDRKPRQILIEAKILELTLDDSLSYGFDWSRFFTSQDGGGSFGAQGLNAPGTPGAFFSLSRSRLTVALDALREQGRVRTLSAPRLLALENEEASVVIGDRQGFRVTTTINQITTESIEFLESGVILRVTPTIDADGAIMLDIHPEVSTGTITDGIPSQTTTEVTTRLLLPDGHSVFIGGLIKNSLSESTSGVPVLGSVPLIRRLFSSEQKISIDTETIVIITPRMVDAADGSWQNNDLEQVQRHEDALQQDKNGNSESIEQLFPSATTTEPGGVPGKSGRAQSHAASPVQPPGPAPGEPVLNERVHTTLLAQRGSDPSASAHGHLAAFCVH